MSLTAALLKVQSFGIRGSRYCTFCVLEATWSNCNFLERNFLHRMPHAGWECSFLTILPFLVLRLCEAIDGKPVTGVLEFSDVTSSRRFTTKTPPHRNVRFHGSVGPIYTYNSVTQIYTYLYTLFYTVWTTSSHLEKISLDSWRHDHSLRAAFAFVCPYGGFSKLGP